MSEIVTSFVDVQHAFVDYPAAGGAIGKLLGKTGTARSVLRDVTFQLDQGQWITLYGAPASGKSTLLRLLTGVIAPTKGSVIVNGAAASEQSRVLAPGYVSSEESEVSEDTVSEVLHAFGTTHGVQHLPSRIGAITEALNIERILNGSAAHLSATERLKLNIARAVLSDSPLVLLDDTADQLGVGAVQAVLPALFEGRTVIVATRSTEVAEQLDVPVLLLYNATLAHHGTCEDIAHNVGCQRIMDVWLEGLRYDLLRALQKHPGVDEVRLISNDRFDGQRVRITLHSSRYMPAVYDLISQANLIRVEEIPASLHDILKKIS